MRTRYSSCVFFRLSKISNNLRSNYSVQTIIFIIISLIIFKCYWRFVYIWLFYLFKSQKKYIKYTINPSQSKHITLHLTTCISFLAVVLLIMKNTMLNWQFIVFVQFLLFTILFRVYLDLIMSLIQSSTLKVIQGLIPLLNQFQISLFSHFIRRLQPCLRRFSNFHNLFPISKLN